MARIDGRFSAEKERVCGSGQCCRETEAKAEHPATTGQTGVNDGPLRTSQRYQGRRPPSPATRSPPAAQQPNSAANPPVSMVVNAWTRPISEDVRWPLPCQVPKHSSNRIQHNRDKRVGHEDSANQGGRDASENSRCCSGQSWRASVSQRQQMLAVNDTNTGNFTGSGPFRTPGPFWSTPGPPASK